VKLKAAKDRILDGLNQVQNVVSTRTTLPILSNVLCKASGNALQLTTTDLDVGIRCEIEVEVQKGGATTLPARRLFSIIRELPTGDIEIEVDEKNVASIKCGSSFFKIMGMPEEEFPPLPKFDGKRDFNLSQQILRDMLKRTSYAISNDETRFVLNGVLMAFKDEKLTVVATDGRRLALTEQELEFAKANEADVILPTKAVNELLRLLTDQGDVKIQIGENQIAFHLSKPAASASKDAAPPEPKGSLLLVSKLIEGTYPNYRQVIPSECKERISLEREGLLTALRRAALLTSDKSNSVKLAFTKNNLSINANTPDVGEARETMAINYKGKEMSIAFNPEYMMDPLRNLDADEVFLEMTDELSPGVIKINAPFLYVLMPMRMS
jgi:DNA polymerase-3 subunit beta